MSLWILTVVVVLCTTGLAYTTVLTSRTIVEQGRRLQSRLERLMERLEGCAEPPDG